MSLIEPLIVIGLVQGQQESRSRQITGPKPEKIITQSYPRTFHCVGLRSVIGIVCLALVVAPPNLALNELIAPVSSYSFTMWRAQAVRGF
jgi:hypothetical protein